jgi:hypothetical protein
MSMEKLSDYGYNVYSQFGEDGIIERIFKVLGTSSKVCVEFGAWDGFYLSNTANLWTKGWKGILIEADKTKYKTLVQNVKKYDCLCINAFVGYDGPSTLENILKQNGVSGDIDLLSIDVDGDDYYILESLEELKPRLIVCEFNPTIPPHMDIIPEKGNYFGCSALSLVKLAEKKGLRLIAASDANCFFVGANDFEKFAAYENNLELLMTRKHLTYFITGFDGDYILSREPAYGANYPSTQKFKGEYYRFRRSLFRTLCFLIKRSLGALGIRIQGFEFRKKKADPGKKNGPQI